jgi:hypothetical protein
MALVVIFQHVFSEVKYLSFFLLLSNQVTVGAKLGEKA